MEKDNLDVKIRPRRKNLLLCLTGRGPQRGEETDGKREEEEDPGG